MVHGRGADRFDNDIDDGWPRLLEDQCQRKMRAGLQRLPQTFQHDMIAAGLEQDRFVWRDRSSDPVCRRRLR